MGSQNIGVLKKLGYIAMFACVTYSALVLAAKPAIAADCTCDSLADQADVYCLDNYDSLAVIAGCEEGDGISFICFGDPFWHFNFIGC